MLDAHRKLIRSAIEPDAFERFWLWGAILIFEGANQPDMARAFVDNALARFPDEPRFVLARAFVVDQMRPLGVFRPGADGRMPADLSTHSKEVIARYDAAMRFDETASEARIRKAWFLHRIGRHADALALVDTAMPLSGDAGLSYFRHLVRGKVLDAAGRTDDAVSAYRAALALAPAAQSARVALMHDLVRQSDHRGARDLAEAIQTLPPEAWDPWWLY